LFLFCRRFKFFIFDCLFIFLRFFGNFLPFFIGVFRFKFRIIGFGDGFRFFLVSVFGVRFFFCRGFRLFVLGYLFVFRRLLGNFLSFFI
jgi:hypothetical protein